MFSTAFVLHIDTNVGGNGGPLMAFVEDRWVLAGVASFEWSFNGEDVVKMYTRASPFVPFIESITTATNGTETTSCATTSTHRLNNTQSHSRADWINILGQLLLIYALSYFFSVLFRSV